MPPPRADARSPCSLSGKKGIKTARGVINLGRGLWRRQASGRRSASITALVPSPAPSAVPAARRSSFQSFPVGRRRSNRCRRSPSSRLVAYAVVVEGADAFHLVRDAGQPSARVRRGSSSGDDRKSPSLRLSRAASPARSRQWPIPQGRSPRPWRCCRYGILRRPWPIRASCR